MKKILTIMLSVFLNVSIAQNIILNNGFETHTANPTATGEWYKCNGWSNVNNSLGSWPYASPDYLSTAGTGQVALPNSVFGTVMPFTGSYVMGLAARYPAAPDFREYLSQPLNTPMTIGQTYIISFYMTNGSANQYSGAGCNRFGVCFSNGPLTQLNHEPINVTPQCEITTDWWSTTWKLVTFTYTAPAAYNYLTIGNFRNDANSVSTNHVTATQPLGVYYFIDEVVLQQLAPLPVSLLNFDGIENKDHRMVLKWTTASELNSDYFTVEKSKDSKTFNPLGTVDAFGTSNQPRNYIYTDEHPVGGYNYYRIKFTDQNGTFSYSKIIAVNDIDNFIEINNFYVDEINSTLQMMIDDASGATVSVNIYDMNGKKCYQNIFPTAVLQRFTIPSAAHGIFIMNVANQNTSKQLKFKM